ncbi:hypothetical protein [Nocardioides sp. 503]|uniref:DUF6916 family protein n=1 Tax=Nocardioides sp. 503 TaxID=2508326 RepID=UPI00106FCF4A|nr:hypothetical protein [Nocardioides sp. 503]
MAGLGWVTYDDFATHVGETFHVTQSAVSGSVLSLLLVDAAVGTEAGGPGPEGQERLQFSLVFGGPAAPALPQGSYALAHEELGELELFLVPIGADADGVRYEAAFA